MMEKIDVLIVDDSAVVRSVLSDILAADPGINIMAAAADPIFAMRRMEKQWPDVIILDIEMPRMDGITFLKKLMSERPTPVVICSTLTESKTSTTLQALAAGAVEIIGKPKVGLKAFLQDERGSIIYAVRSAAQAKMKNLCKAQKRPKKSKNQGTKVEKKHSADVILPHTKKRHVEIAADRIVVMGTSTGGTQALEMVLSSLPRESPGIVVVQHMPEKFTKAFADRLNSICEVEVREAKTGDMVAEGLALIAPGGRHVALKRRGERYYIDVMDGPLVNRHRPSVDVLFRSAANTAGPNALGIIMTGMGDDGASGIHEMHTAGARTVAQDEKTSVVFGMPREAIKRGCIDDIISLQDISGEIISYAQGK